MADKILVIVESPTKAKTITKFLGKNYIVKASYGHIRDLPNSASEIPLKLKKEKWAKMGINIEHNFDPLYIIPPKKKDQVSKLKEALKDAKELLLATDEDREGESISWHLLETLNPKVPTKRLVFHEITKEAIKKALESTREVDMDLVRAQETRRIIDRLFGYEVSPVLWRKIAPRLSAGRVQSVAVRLLVERERERIKFRSADYWDLKAQCTTGTGGTTGTGRETDKSKENFEAEITHIENLRLASGKDFDPATGLLKSQDSVKLYGEKEATALANNLTGKNAVVKQVEEKPFSSSPPAPFVTSSIQQEANRKLRFSAQRTMRVAQELYENGFITYMRTDSTSLSDQAINAARKFIKDEYGDNYLPSTPRKYATKVKNAQEAHEAIRPAGEEFTPPEAVMEKLGDDAFKLYDLIWKRTVACQMENAKGTYVGVTLSVDSQDLNNKTIPVTLRASGKTIEFPGFLRAYVEGSDDPDSDIADQEKILPKMVVGQEVLLRTVLPLSHSTLPPARYTEGSMIRELEKRGIGRPSTWASVVELVLSRQYAFKKGTALVPSFTAMAVVGMLENNFHQLMDYDFTAKLEDDLDAISRGETENVPYLTNFYFGPDKLKSDKSKKDTEKNNLTGKGLKELIEQGVDKIDPREVCGLPIGRDSEDRLVEVRIGKFGPFLSNGTQRTSVPEGMPPDELRIEEATELLASAEKGPESLGSHPETGEPIFLKVGRYGPYVQLGVGDGEKRPKMSSLIPGMPLESVDLETAVKLLELPKDLGPNPDNSTSVFSKLGPYGPYVECGVERRTIPMDSLSPISITLDQAVELLRQPKTRGRVTTKPQVLKEIGVNPAGLPVQLLSGRYGPYVTDGTTNASAPKGVDPMNITLETALDLIKEREGMTPKKKPRKKSESTSAKKPKKKKS